LALSVHSWILKLKEFPEFLFWCCGAIT